MNRKTCLVFAATSEIASSIIISLKQEFDRFILVARSKEKLRQLVQKVQFQNDTEIIEYTAELTDFPNLKMICSEIIEKYQNIELLLIAQGVNDFVENKKNTTSPEIARKTIELNFLSAVNCIEPFVPYFKNNRKGHIAAIASLAGLRGRRKNYYYGASKAALITYLSGLRIELLSNNITVSTIFPGFIYSPISNYSETRLTKFFFRYSFQIGPSIAKQLLNRKKIVYTPRYWRFIAWFIQLAPEFILVKFF